jgi:hypothetical protein
MQKICQPNGILFAPGPVPSVLIMHEEKNEKQYSYIDVADQGSMTYWEYHLACNGAELRDAVDSVGSDPGKVREYLSLLRGETHRPR